MTVSKEFILEVLERALWAPSGDNGQPWAFELKGGGLLKIHLTHQPDNVYEYKNGEPIWMGAGALLETIDLVAATKGLSVQLLQLTDFGGDGKGIIELQFKESTSAPVKDLEKYIEQRRVVRTAFQMKDIDAQQVSDLQAALGDEFSLKWFTSLPEKWKIIKLNMIGTSIRLSIEETFKTHQDVIDWKNDFSPTGIPAKALGVSKATLILTKWAMQSWTRMNFLMKYMGGTIIPRLEADLIPGLFCARHFVMTATADQNMDDPITWLNVGRAVQRFWLCATKQRLCLQPGLAPVIFAKHAEIKAPFTKDKAARKKAEQLMTALEKASGSPSEKIVFAGRIGSLRHNDEKVKSRSTRKPLSDLIIHN